MTTLEFSVQLYQNQTITYVATDKIYPHLLKNIFIMVPVLKFLVTTSSSYIF